MARAFLLILLIAFPLGARQQAAPPPAAVEQEPPEEDPDLKPTEYAFNPLEASRNITAGNFYLKKGNYKAAARRYVEAAKWDPTSAEAQFKLGEANEKMRETAGAREAYEKFLTLATDAKDIEAVKKRLAKLPRTHGKK